MKDIDEYKLVIFDLDGTLYHKYLMPFFMIASDIRDVRMLGINERVRREMRGRYFSTLIEYQRYYGMRFSKATDGKTTPAQALEWYNDVFLPLLTSVTGKRYNKRPMIEQMAEALRNRGILSGVYSDYPQVPARLRALNISPEIFDGMWSAETFGGLKPAPEPFMKILTGLSVKPRDTLVVGDRDDTDGMLANAVGADFVQIVNSMTSVDRAKGRYSWKMFCDSVL